MVVDYKVLSKDIPLGELAGRMCGKVGSGLVLGIRHPLTGLSELAGIGEGFFAGLKTGIEVSRANFELAKTRGEYNALKRGINNSSRIFDESFVQFRKLQERLEQLPSDLRERLFPQAKPEAAPA